MPYFDEMRNDQYITIAGPGMDEVTIQKSRFIGQAWPCINEEEAIKHIQHIRETARDARHHCYAYIVGENEGIMRFSDDGEPSGTAGMPMLSLMRSEHIVNCCVVVTRYFGGILLGTGGLVRAYTQGCRIALKAAGIVQMEKTCFYLCEVPYSYWDSVRYMLERLPARYQDVEFGSAVSFLLLTRVTDRESVFQSLHQMLGNSFETLFEGERYEAWTKS